MPECNEDDIWAANPCITLKRNPDGKPEIDLGLAAEQLNTAKEDLTNAYPQSAELFAACENLEGLLTVIPKRAETSNAVEHTLQA